MIKGVKYFVFEEIVPRAASLCRSSSLWLALAIGAMATCGKLMGLRSEGTVVGLANVATTYAAISFGFCVSGLSLVLSCSRSSFTSRLVATRAEKAKFNALSDLIFVFSWTAIVHWVLLILAFVTTAFVDPGTKIVGGNASVVMLIGIGLGVALFSYAILEFLSVLITLSQFGRAMSVDLSNVSEGGVGKGN
jgi:hypothetical protein